MGLRTVRARFSTRVAPLYYEDWNTSSCNHEQSRSMKFLIDRLSFRDALQKVEMAIDRKPTRPVLGGVLLEAQNDSVVLQTNDLDISVRYRIENVQVEIPGYAVIPGRELVDLARDFESETIRVQLSDSGQIHLEAGEDVCTLVTMESSAGNPGWMTEGPREFPGVSPLEGTPTLTVAKHDFFLMVQATRFATSRVNDGRFATEGVLFDAENERLTMVGTDGRRLACIRRSISSQSKEKKRTVLMPKVLDQIVRFGQDEEGDSIEVFFLGNRVGFRCGRLESFGRVLEGEFPNYDNVIPKSAKHVVRAHRDSISKKLKLASHLTQDAAAVVRIQFSSDSMEVSAEHEGRGRAAASLEVDYTGEPFSASFNPSYLLDGLKAAQGEQVEIQVEEPTRPVKFVLGEEFDYVVMPLTSFA